MNQQLVIVWAALAVLQVIYLFVPVPEREHAASPNVFPLALGAVAVVQSIGIVALLRIRAFNPVQAGRLDPMSKPGAAQLFTTLMLAWVLAESVAIYGLVLRFLHFQLTYSLPFVVVGAFLLFLGRPWNPKLQRPSSTADLSSSSAPLN